MSPSRFSLILFTALFSISFICTGCSASESSESQAEFLEPDQWGPYAVGVKEYLFTDETREERPLPTLIYYPAEGHPIEGGEYFGDLDNPSQFAEEDAAPLHTFGPYPIIMFSHGSGGQKEAQKFLLEYLASHGYIAVAPDHTGNVTMANFSPDDPMVSVNRPLDIVFVLDETLALFSGSTDFLAGLGDATRIGVSGHSLGGYTALATVGANYNWSMFELECTEEQNNRACAFMANREQLESSLPDPRLKALVSLAHCGATTTLGPACAGATAITVPTLMMAGDQDAICIYEDQVPDCYDKSPQPIYEVLMHGGAHVGFTDMFNEGSMATARIHELIQRYATAFFGYYIKGDERYFDYLGNEQAGQWNEDSNDFDYSADPDRGLLDPSRLKASD
jgi:predicted dienelactone hydrolase